MLHLYFWTFAESLTDWTSPFKIYSDILNVVRLQTKATAVTSCGHVKEFKKPFKTPWSCYKLKLQQWHLVVRLQTKATAVTASGQVAN